MQHCKNRNVALLMNTLCKLTRGKHVDFSKAHTVDREEFAFKIIHGLNFCIKNITSHFSFFTRLIFVTLAYGRKYFNSENFPIYGSSTSKWQKYICSIIYGTLNSHAAIQNWRDPSFFCTRGYLRAV